MLADGSSIVINASWTSHRGMAIAGIYSASKAALLSLARSLAADLAHRGIRVNSISPGYIVTEMFDESVPTDEHREAMRAQVPLGRLGDPADIADVVAFLLSGAARYVTGQDLIVDGGLLGSIPLAG